MYPLDPTLTNMLLVNFEGVLFGPGGVVLTSSGKTLYTITTYKQLDIMAYKIVVGSGCTPTLLPGPTAKVTVIVVTDLFPFNTLSYVNTCTKIETGILLDDFSTLPFTEYTFSILLQPGLYTFVMKDIYGDGMCNQISFSCKQYSRQDCSPQPFQPHIRAPFICTSSFSTQKLVSGCGQCYFIPKQIFCTS